MLMGIIDESSKKYLKNMMKLYPGDPLDPFININIADNRTMTRNKILLKKFN